MTRQSGPHLRVRRSANPEAILASPARRYRLLSISVGACFDRDSIGEKAPLPRRV